MSTVFPLPKGRGTDRFFFTLSSVWKPQLGFIFMSNKCNHWLRNMTSLNPAYFASRSCNFPYLDLANTLLHPERCVDRTHQDVRQHNERIENDYATFTGLFGVAHGSLVKQILAGLILDSSGMDLKTRGEAVSH